MRTTDMLYNAKVKPDGLRAGVLGEVGGVGAGASCPVEHAKGGSIRGQPLRSSAAAPS